nr:hypothetical protein [Clostridium estertheticum]
MCYIYKTILLFSVNNNIVYYFVEILAITQSAPGYIAVDVEVK